MCWWYSSDDGWGSGDRSGGCDVRGSVDERFGGGCVGGVGNMVSVIVVILVVW